LQALQKAAAKPHKTAVSSAPSRQAQSAKTTKTPAVAAKSTARPAASPSAKKRQKSS
jgi:hypothetical protein